MDIERLSLGASVRLILRHGRLRRRGILVFKAAVREFFLPQFQSRLLPGFRPVAVLAHPLDDCLPFDPSLFRRYLGYFTVWLKTLACLYRICGKSVLRDVEGMMRDLVLLYRASGSVYRHCQSTTTSRRAAPANPYFLLIAVFDPHLHCIPSLHVLTVCYNYHRTREILTRVDPKGASGSRLAAETYRAALRITEAILLVKQHSLLDIGPSLFLLSRLFPAYDDREIRRFVSELFAEAPVPDPAAAVRFRELILESYRGLLARQKERAECDPTTVILEYLRGLVRSHRRGGQRDPSRLPRRPGGS
jgi:hypothetical protein